MTKIVESIIILKKFNMVIYNCPKGSYGHCVHSRTIGKRMWLKALKTVFWQKDERSRAAIFRILKLMSSPLKELIFMDLAALLQNAFLNQGLQGHHHNSSIIEYFCSNNLIFVYKGNEPNQITQLETKISNSQSLIQKLAILLPTGMFWNNLQWPLTYCVQPH